MRKPIGTTMGDPCGIGPEIVARLFADGLPQPTVVFGDAGVMERTVRALGLPLRVQSIAMVEEAVHDGKTIPVLNISDLPEDLPIGRVDARAGRASYDYVVRAIDEALAGTIGAIVTAPINKEAMKKAGITYPGHTEILAARSGTDAFAMMLANDELRVILVTIHVSLREAIERVRAANVLETLRITHHAVGAALGRAPRIGVAGLNPHAGEGGLFGREEIEQIAPAVAQAQAEGIDARGPFAPDTVFMRARAAHGRSGEFDVVVAMYHDQGLIPVKYLGVERGVNVTLGLPFVRTSPDHGTAFDRAGSGRADAQSLLAAIRMARDLMS